MLASVLRMADPALRSCGPNATVLCAAALPAPPSTISAAPNNALLISCSPLVDELVPLSSPARSAARIARRVSPHVLAADRGPRSCEPRLSPLLRPHIRAHALEHLHTRIPLIGDVDAILVVHEEAGGQQKLSGPGAGCAHEQQDLAVGVEDLEVVERRVGDIDVPLAVHADALGAVQVSGSVPLAADALHERAGGVEHLDAKVERVGDVQPPLPIDRQVPREVELAVFP